MDVCVIAQNYKCEVCQDRHLWRNCERQTILKPPKKLFTLKNQSPVENDNANNREWHGRTECAPTE